MKSEHTPGPWRWLDGNSLMGDHSNRPIILSARGMLSRNSDGFLKTNNPESPDCRLIAAAPDLLRHAKIAAEILRGLQVDEDDEIGRASCRERV